MGDYESADIPFCVDRCTGEQIPLGPDFSCPARWHFGLAISGPGAQEKWEQAITPKSGEGKGHCELLALQGDAVLKTFVLEALIARMPDPRLLTHVQQLAQLYLSNSTLPKLDDFFHLRSVIRVPKAAKLSDREVATVIEALLGACYNVRGHDTARDLVFKCMGLLDGSQDPPIKCGDPYWMDWRSMSLGHAAGRVSCGDRCPFYKDDTRLQPPPTGIREGQAALQSLLRSIASGEAGEGGPGPGSPSVSSGSAGSRDRSRASPVTSTGPGGSKAAPTGPQDLNNMRALNESSIRPYAWRQTSASGSPFAGPRSLSTVLNPSAAPWPGFTSGAAKAAATELPPSVPVSRTAAADLLGRSWEGLAASAVSSTASDRWTEAEMNRARLGAESAAAAGPGTAAPQSASISPGRGSDQRLWGIAAQPQPQQDSQSEHWSYQGAGLEGSRPRSRSPSFSLIADRGKSGDQGAQPGPPPLDETSSPDLGSIASGRLTLLDLTPKEQEELLRMGSFPSSLDLLSSLQGPGQTAALLPSQGTQSQPSQSGAQPLAYPWKPLSDVDHGQWAQQLTRSAQASQEEPGEQVAERTGISRPEPQQPLQGPPTPEAEWPQRQTTQAERIGAAGDTIGMLARATGEAEEGAAGGSGTQAAAGSSEYPPEMAIFFSTPTAFKVEGGLVTDLDRQIFRQIRERVKRRLGNDRFWCYYVDPA